MDTERQKFKDSFHLPFDNFLEPTDYTDAFGFSTMKKYGNGYASAVGISISKEELTSPRTLKSLNVHVSYGKETPNGLVVSSSSEKIKKLFDPIDLQSNDDYFYDIKDSKFYYKLDRTEAKQILIHIYNQHQKSTRPLRGLFLRAKLVFWRVILFHLIKQFFKITAFLFRIITDSEVSPSIWTWTLSTDRYQQHKTFNQPPVKEGKIIEFLGYKASARSIIFYSYVHFFLFLIFFGLNYKPQILVAIFSNSFITVIYVITTISIFEILVPKLLKFLLNTSTTWFRYTAFKKIKI
ncbi:hypothetical protein A2662_02365 [Candidatus Giovannonibacteria bacterium RIFCSPHIGHO2_01_FULL_45_33]|nr:MAG: hypothetical protein A2662_02365 [Candidatus Giovannonibacteria bacterium RIFCSPHIGHO2_01_FULL_45_33]